MCKKWNCYALFCDEKWHFCIRTRPWHKRGPMASCPQNILWHFLFGKATFGQIGHITRNLVSRPAIFNDINRNNNFIRVLITQCTQNILMKIFQCGWKKSTKSCLTFSSSESETDFFKFWTSIQENSFRNLLYSDSFQNILVAHLHHESGFFCQRPRTWILGIEYCFNSLTL
jgi:hypothetical protein